MRELLESRADNFHIITSDPYNTGRTIPRRTFSAPPIATNV